MGTDLELRNKEQRTQRKSAGESVSKRKKRKETLFGGCGVPLNRTTSPMAHLSFFSYFSSYSSCVFLHNPGANGVVVVAVVDSYNLSSMSFLSSQL